MPWLEDLKYAEYYYWSEEIISEDSESNNTQNIIIGRMNLSPKTPKSIEIMVETVLSSSVLLLVVSIRQLAIMMFKVSLRVRLVFIKVIL
jgi:hypothetical protein